MKLRMNVFSASGRVQVLRFVGAGTRCAAILSAATLCAVLTGCKVDRATHHTESTNNSVTSPLVPASTVDDSTSGYVPGLPLDYVGQWQPASQTARAVTAIMSLGPQSFSVGYQRFPISNLSALNEGGGTRLNAALNLLQGPPHSGYLAQINVPAGTKLRNGNTLCSGHAVTWVAFVQRDNALGVAFFSGSSAPHLQAQWLSNTHDLCGTYGYTRN
jgi:hypothetical protein